MHMVSVNVGSTILWASNSIYSVHSRRYNFVRKHHATVACGGGPRRQPLHIAGRPEATSAHCLAPTRM